MAGEALQHHGQVPGALPGTHRRAIVLRKDLRKLLHPDGERLSLQDSGPDPQCNPVHAARICLARNGSEHVIQRKSGGAQGSQQSGEQGEFLTTETWSTQAQSRQAHAGAALAETYIERSEFLFAELFARLAFRIRLDHAALLRAVRREGGVVEGGHQRCGPDFRGTASRAAVLQARSGRQAPFADHCP